MTAPTEKIMHYGLRHVRVIGLNTSGTPAATGTSAYEGLQIKGSTAFDLTLPDSRKLTGLGEDGITQVVYLPPLEGADARLSVEGTDPAVATLLDNTLIATVGEMSVIGLATDRQGFEPQVALHLYQAARGLDTGKVYWHNYFIPSAQVVRKAPSMNGDKAITIYQVAPNRVNKHLWGPSFSMLTEGFLSAQVVEGWSNYPVRIAAFLADGVEDVFTFPTEFPAVQTAGINVYVDDVLTTVGITKATSGVTFASVPTASKRIVTIREITG